MRRSLILVAGLLGGFVAPTLAVAQQLHTREEREWVRPESDALPREPHGRRLPAPTPSGKRFVEVRQMEAREARQGVAVDADHVYAIANYQIGKYDKRTGEKVGEWNGGPDGPIVHLNSCLVEGARLICAHSNHPGIPMLSSVEIWDTRTLEHVESYSFGAREGSLTWVLPADDGWWAAFAHYANYSGIPGRGSEWSSLTRYDAEWNRRQSYAFPVTLIERFTPDSSSGGNWGADGRLYVTGHDAAEVYVLQLPKMGSVLEWVDTWPAPMEGQAWVFDPAEPTHVWGILRSTGEVVEARMQ